MSIFLVGFSKAGFVLFMCFAAYFSAMKLFPAAYSGVHAFLNHQVPSFTVLIMQIYRYYKYTAHLTSCL